MLEWIVLVICAAGGCAILGYFLAHIQGEEDVDALIHEMLCLDKNVIQLRAIIDLLAPGLLDGTISTEDAIDVWQHRICALREDAYVAESLQAFALEEFLFDTHAEANVVLTHLRDFIRRHGKASVQDYYDLAGATGATYLDAKCGWKDLNGARIVQTTRGHIISFPDVIRFEEEIIQ